TFNPKIKEQEYNSYFDKVKYVIKPLFPGYIFAQFSTAKLRQVKFTRGVNRVVSFGDLPASVEDKVIFEIKARVGVDGYISMVEELAGDKVTIKEGHMAAFTSIFTTTVSAGDRVRVLLETLSYQAHLEIGREPLSGDDIFSSQTRFRR